MKLPKINHKPLLIMSLILSFTILSKPVIAQYDVNNTGVSDVNGLSGNDVRPAIGSEFGTVRAIADTNNAYALFGDGNDVEISGDFPADGIIYAEAGNDGAYGLYADSNGVITTSAINGTITATAGNENAYGFYSSNSITIGDVNGTITASAYSGAYGLHSVDDSITTGAINGTISAIADTNSAYGLSADKSIITGNINGTITATAGNDYAYSLYSNNSITIGDMNGTITATADANYASGLYAYSSITTGDVNGTITSETGGDSAFGLISTNGSITTGNIDGTVYITAGTNNASGLESKDSITIGNINGTIDVAAYTNNAYGVKSSDGSVTIGDIGGNIYIYTETYRSYGILSSGGQINIGDISGTIYARADTNDAFGLYSYSDSGSLTTGEISGNVIAYAGGDNAYGILSYGPMDITVNGGYVYGYAGNDPNSSAAIQSGRIESGVLNSQNADDSVEIVAGSRITGDIDLAMNGTDNDVLTLSGVDTNSTTLNYDLKNIETINLTGGTWRLNGTVSNNTNGIEMTGGVLNGTGTLGSLNVTDGTLAPGYSIGTTTIDGDLTLGADSTLEIEVDNSGNSDKVVVTGDVSINNGTLKTVSTETISSTHEYTIIEANNVSGEFDTVDTALLQTLLSEVQVGVDYLADSVILTVIPERFDNPAFFTTDNQRSLGSALQQIADNGGNGVTTALQQLASIGEVRSAYDQLCGQTRTSLALVSAMSNTRFTDTVSNRLHNTQSVYSYETNTYPLLAMAQPDRNTSMYDTDTGMNSFAIGNGTKYFASEKWGLWLRGYGVFGERDTGSEVPGYQYSVYGTSFGMDYKYTDELILGITGGYSDGHVNYSSSKDESDITSTPIGIYGSWFTKKGYIDSIVSYASMDYETERTVNLTSETLKGEFDGYETSAYLEAGRNWFYGKDTLIQPMASFQISYLKLDNYIEAGGVSALSFDEHSYQSYKGSLGMKVKKHLGNDTEDRNTVIELRGRWLHEFGDTEANISASFVDSPAAAFKISDDDLPRDSAVLGAGFRHINNQNLMFFVDYDTSLNKEDTSHIISAGFRYRW